MAQARRFRRSASRAEAFAQVLDEQIGLLERSEVSAARHGGVANDVVPTLRRLERRMTHRVVAREERDRRRYIDLARHERPPQLVANRSIQSETSFDAAIAQEIEHDVGEEDILGEDLVEVPVVVGPGVELLRNPGGGAHWAVRQSD